MKVAAIALFAALLFALPASAGPVDCSFTDTDSDGHVDNCDNCDAIPNPTQNDDDSDGYGDICDCDYDNNNACDGSDFLLFGAGFGQPPGSSCGNPKGTPCP
jgi:hypothetical protein